MHEWHIPTFLMRALRIIWKRTRSRGNRLLEPDLNRGESCVLMYYESCRRMAKQQVEYLEGETDDVGPNAALLGPPLGYLRYAHGISV